MSILVEVDEALYRRDAFAAFDADKSFDLDNARAMMWLAQLAYETNHPDKIRRLLAAWELSELKIITAPAVYPAGDGLFVAFQAPGARCPKGGEGGPTVLQIKAGSPPAMSTAWCGAVRGRGSAMVTTTDGRANPIVWIPGAEGDNRLHGFKGDSGEELFASERLAGLRRFQTVVATQDRLYVGADGRVFAFAFE